MERLLRLPDRLLVIAELIGEGAAVADIGTDHGFLPVYLAQKGFARSIIASDISAGSLESARRTAAYYGVTDKIEFAVARGLDGLDETKADTIVISGLGGETIMGILNEAPWTMHPSVNLILQPQSKINELCGFLRERRYNLHDVRLAYNNGRYYTVLYIQGDIRFSILEIGLNPMEFPKPEYELLYWLSCSEDSLFLGYIDSLIAKNNKIIAGKKGSKMSFILRKVYQTMAYEKIRELYIKCL